MKEISEYEKSTTPVPKRQRGNKIREIRAKNNSVTQ